MIRRGPCDGPEKPCHKCRLRGTNRSLSLQATKNHAVQQQDTNIQVIDSSRCRAFICVRKWYAQSVDFRWDFLPSRFSSTVLTNPSQRGDRWNFREESSWIQL
jgi:hypothetical protein